MESIATLSPLLSSTQAATMLGVHAASVKRWSDQGKIKCIRTPGGHRRFLRSEIEAIRRAPVDTPEAFLDRLLQALVSGAQMTAEGELLSFWGESGRWERVGDTIGILLENMGQAWRDGTMLISEEHIASETLLRSIARLNTMMPQRPNAPVCVLATAPGDEHTIGLAMSELVLAEHDWKTLWLGRNCPVETLVEVMQRPDVDMLALSASSFSQTPGVLGRLVRTLGPVALATNTQIILGGSGAWPESVFGVERVRSYEAFGQFLRAQRSERIAQ